MLLTNKLYLKLNLHPMLSIPTPIAHHPNSIEVIIAVITWILGWATIHNVTSPILVLLAILPHLPFPRTDLTQFSLNLIVKLPP